MKKLIFVLLFLFACGQESNDFADISMTHITSEGTLAEYPILLAKFQEVKDCVGAYGYNREGEPYIITVSGTFTCGQNEGMVGCTVFHENTLYMIGSDLYVDPNIFAHEAVHWLTGASHGTAVFTQCSVY